MNDDPIVRLATALAAGRVGQAIATVRPGLGKKQSAVLALFSDDAVVLQLRAGGLRNHAGQVSFPGGQIEPDETPLEAALRETWEETDISPDTVTILGELPVTHIPASNNDVTTIVGWAADPQPRTVSVQEVAVNKLIPIAELVDPDNRFEVITPSGLHTPGFHACGLFVWGFTAFVLDELLSSAGWAKDWDHSRIRTIPR